MFKDCPYKTNCNGHDCDKEFCLRKYKLDILYDNSLLPENQRKHVALVVDGDGTDLDEFKQLAEISKNIKSFVENGTNLFLHSKNCGNGKSSWAIRLIESYFEAVWYKVDLNCKALFINVPKFLLALKDNISIKNDYITFIKANIQDADIVVWDDIAAKMGTEFEINNLLSFIESRLAVGKTNIYTSNLDKQEMSVALGERIASRISYKAIDIELKGRDKRGLALGGNV